MNSRTALPDTWKNRQEDENKGRGVGVKEIIVFVPGTSICIFTKKKCCKKMVVLELPLVAS